MAKRLDKQIINTLSVCRDFKTEIMAFVRAISVMLFCKRSTQVNVLYHAIAGVSRICPIDTFNVLWGQIPRRKIITIRIEILLQLLLGKSISINI